MGSLVFKTSGGAKVPRRVRFPSASAQPAGGQGAGFPPGPATVEGMSNGHRGSPLDLAVVGLVDTPQRFSLERLRGWGGHRGGASGETVIPLRAVIEQAGLSAAADHVSAVSADGSYTASIPLAEALAKGEIRVGGASGGGPAVQLEVPGGLTKCWNVKGLGLLRVTEGPEPDSLPDVLTH